MVAGKHTSRRVALAVPPAIYDQLSQWAEAEGRPVGQLCMFLIEQSLRQAQRDGIAPTLEGTIKQAMAEQNVPETQTMNEEEVREVLDTALEFIMGRKLKADFDKVDPNGVSKIATELHHGLAPETQQSAIKRIRRGLPRGLSPEPQPATKERIAQDILDLLNKKLAD